MEKLRNDKWYIFDDMTQEEKLLFNAYPQELVVCYFNNGDILRYEEAMPFSELIGLFFLPKP